MDYVFILIVLFTVHYFIGYIVEVLNLKLISFLISLLLLCLVFYYTLGLHYTADYNMYYYLFKLEHNLTDIGFKELTKIYKQNGLKFHDLLVSHLLAMAVLYYLFINKFTYNYFFVFLPFFILDYVHYANQIRYYLGFSILLFAFYFMYKRKFLWMIICCIFAFISHSALLILFVFIPFYFLTNNKNFFRIIFSLSIISVLVVFVILSMGFANEIEHFGEYFDNSAVSSFLGGLLSALPYFILFTHLYFITQFYQKNNQNWNEDSQYVFLYKLSFFTLIFIPASIFLQIVGHRYIMPFIIIYSIYVLYIFNNVQESSKRIFILSSYSLSCLLCGIVIYILPSFVLSENHFMNELELMLKSIRY